jgi:outer membrane receptor protein involved in Fe transport
VQLRPEGVPTDCRHWRQGLARVLVVAASLPVTPAFAGGLAGVPLSSAVADLERRGLVVLYSSDLVRPWMKVTSEPASTEPAEILAEILAPHGLAARSGPGGLSLVVRRPRIAHTASTRRTGIPHTVDWASLEEVVVTTSRYRLDSLPAMPIVLESAELGLLPDLGDDPLRATARLPGAAAGDLSAKANLRGGEVDETLVRFDGLRLFNPFHFKDFQNIFSTIDPAIVRGIEVYTGAFPAAYGDRMSGVISIDSLAAANAPQNEIALSLYNASARFARSFDDGRGEWLLSARRSNLDVLLELAHEDRGEPGYTDMYGRLGYQITDALAVTGSALRFDDDLELNDTDFEETAVATYRDAYYWLRLNYEPGPDLHGRVLLARSELDSDRSGSVDQPGIASGELADRRRFAIESVQTDWSLARTGSLAFAFGAEWRHMDGHYDYRDQVEFDLLFTAPGAPQQASRERMISVAPSGDQFGAYASVRAQPAESLVVDLGLRWDHQTLSDGEDVLSPRASVLWLLGDRTRARAAWGRYFQAQAINELPVPDGVAEFHRPQRADHWVAGIEYQHPADVDLRLEIYRKDYDRLRPRFENLFNAAVLLPELKPDRVRIAPDSAQARGVELTVSRETDPLRWWLTYSWASARDWLEGARSNRSWDQAHAFGAGVAWRTPKWELSLAGRYHSGWPTTALTLAETEPLPIVATGPRNAERLGDYRSLDARIARNFSFEDASELTVYFEVTNLFNENNPCCVEYEITDDDENGESILEVEPVNYLPALPSLGVVWRF